MMMVEESVMHHNAPKNSVKIVAKITSELVTSHEEVRTVRHIGALLHRQMNCLPHRMLSPPSGHLVHLLDGSYCFVFVHSWLWFSQQPTQPGPQFLIN